MGKPHPVELRQRVVDFVAEGNTHRSAASRFRVGKLSGLKAWVARRIGQKRDLTVAELAAEIAATQGASVHRSSV